MKLTLDKVLGIIAGLVLIAFVVSQAIAQPSMQDRPIPAPGTPPHVHGDTVPDWYDASCCDNKDCRPVPDSEIEEIDADVWLHKPTGLIFKKVEQVDDGEGGTVSSTRVRESKDGRFHVCFTPELVRGAPSGRYTGYCIYVKRTMI